jgi:hypothetical protein
MPRASVPRNLMVQGLLPSICIVCGREATSLRFPDLGAPSAGAPLTSPLWALLKSWAYIVRSSWKGEESQGGLPFCKRHQSYWPRRAWFIIGGWVILIVSMALGILLTKLTNPDPPPHWTFVVAICWLLVFLPTFLIVHLASLRMIASSPESVTLAGANRKFVAALKAEEGQV